MAFPQATPQIVKELAPTGALRAAINMGNKLLVSGGEQNGQPVGVSPSMAAAIAEHLGVPVHFLKYAKPGQVADDGGTGKWDIGNIGAEPQRAAKISFTAAYAEIEATYLVPAGSPIRSLDDVDKPGTRIMLNKGSAFDLWLERHIRQATLMYPQGTEKAFEVFARGGIEVHAGLRPALLKDTRKMPGSRILEGNFTTVQQAVGTAKTNEAGFRFLKDFVEEAKRSGLVAKFIAQHKVEGLSVAKPA